MCTTTSQKSILHILSSSGLQQRLVTDDFPSQDDHFNPVNQSQGDHMHQFSHAVHHVGKPAALADDQESALPSDTASVAATVASKLQVDLRELYSLNEQLTDENQRLSKAVIDRDQELQRATDLLQGGDTYALNLANMEQAHMKNHLVVERLNEQVGFLSNQLADHESELTRTRQQLQQATRSQVESAGQANQLRAELQSKGSLEASLNAGKRVHAACGFNR
jgi:chromosome segregation ATPase